MTDGSHLTLGNPKGALDSRHRDTVVFKLDTATMKAAWATHVKLPCNDCRFEPKATVATRSGTVITTYDATASGSRTYMGKMTMHDGATGALIRDTDYTAKCRTAFLAKDPTAGSSKAFVTGQMEGLNLNPFSTPGFLVNSSGDGGDWDAYVASIDAADGSSAWTTIIGKDGYGGGLTVKGPPHITCPLDPSAASCTLDAHVRLVCSAHYPPTLRRPRDTGLPRRVVRHRDRPDRCRDHHWHPVLARG